jgi:hypothetical protein
VTMQRLIFLFSRALRIMKFWRKGREEEGGGGGEEEGGEEK